MNNTEKALIALIRNAVCDGKDTVEIESIEEAQQIWELAREHSVENILATEFIKHPLFAEDEEMKAFFSQEIYYAMCDSEQRDFETSRVTKALDLAGIEYIPLKGAVIKDYYPESWYRTSSDVDILVREEQLNSAVEAVLNIPGYTAGEKCKHDIGLRSENGYHIELHFVLMEYFPKADSVLSRVWEYSHSDNGLIYRMSDEFYYLYHIIHMAKHFIHGGCGIKPFVDMWLIENRFTINYDNFTEMLDACGMRAFYENVRDVMKIWFGDEVETDISEKIIRYIFDGGVYGTQEQMTAVDSLRSGKRGYILTRLFLPMEEMKISYKILNKYPFLAPYYHIKRIVKVITDGRVGRSIREIKINNNLDEDKLDEVKTMLKRCELI